MIRVRFAPSPTGFLHVGGARTALYNYFYAKHCGGKFILRIEDTDIARSTRESEQMVLDSLLWLGITWDEGPDVGGQYGPYRQTERIDIYKEYAKKLMDTGAAYEVYASAEEIKVLHENLMNAGKAPHYSKEMFEVYDTPERREDFEKKGIKPAIFFSMPRKEYNFNDGIKGEIKFKKGALGDFAILRSNGFPTYNFAVVIDDMLMRITDIIRGDDHVSNTLKQLAIYEAFDAEVPNFAHASTILGPDGKKLSKRHGATSIEDFKIKGFLPEALDNFLALLGWSHPKGKDIMSISDMIDNFSIDRMNSSPAIFDETRAKWINGHFIREENIDRITELSIPYIVDSGLMTYTQAESNLKWLKKAVDSIRKGVLTISEIPEKLKVYFDEVDPSLIDCSDEKSRKIAVCLKNMTEMMENMDAWNPKEIIDLVKRALKDNKPDRKCFYSCLRKVLTDQDEGPELVDIIFLLGRTKVMNRIGKAVGKL
jgi:nondiscriminating glutamyl-tRNA synthetase